MRGQIIFFVTKKTPNGWPEGIEPSPAGPQPAVLPLNYGHPSDVFICPREESNLDHKLRRLVLYPLSYRDTHIYYNTLLQRKNHIVSTIKRQLTHITNRDAPTGRLYISCISLLLHQLIQYLAGFARNTAPLFAPFICQPKPQLKFPNCLLGHIAIHTSY